MSKLLFATLLLAAAAFAQHDHSPATQHDAMNARGDKAMGFDQDKTTHHFRVLADGGAIEVTANDPKDRDSISQVRMHLGHIAQMFAAGDFSIPHEVHAATPPGAAAMKALRSDLKYTYEEIDRGGRVRIRSANPKAVAAVHDFLRYQIKEHRTGDPLAAAKP